MSFSILVLFVTDNPGAARPVKQGLRAAGSKTVIPFVNEL
jgi:hypothetical protein